MLPCRIVSVRTIGIDTGKNTFQLIGLDPQGTIVLREKLARGQIGERLANASPCLINIEAGMATTMLPASCWRSGIM
jgi:transposase